MRPSKLVALIVPIYSLTPKSGIVITYDLTISSFEESLKKLQTDYVDLLLIHWPNPIAYRDDWETANAETWRAMEMLQSW